MENDQVRCQWAMSDELMRAYHDTEWGVPQFDSRALWECLMLEGFQAGLSWSIILKRREALREAFAGFDPTAVSEFDEERIQQLLVNKEIIRSRAKILATIEGAKIYLAMNESFSEFAWKFVDGKPIESVGEVCASTPLSETISKELKRLGFKFVGPVITYAWMHAVGLVNDHEPTCFRR